MKKASQIILSKENNKDKFEIKMKITIVVHPCRIKKKYIFNKIKKENHVLGKRATCKDQRIWKNKNLTEFHRNVFLKGCLDVFALWPNSKHHWEGRACCQQWKHNGWVAIFVGLNLSAKLI